MQTNIQNAQRHRFDNLLLELDQRKKLVKEYLLREEYASRFKPVHIHDATYSYINLGGKSLRPAVLLLSCGAVGGDEKIALPAAAAIEVYHTWTLVHDDIIDKDDRRRGHPTVHNEFTTRAHHDLGWQGSDAQHYGLAIAMLAGDVQQAWSWSLLLELYTRQGVDPRIVIQLASELAIHVQNTLVEGEVLDVQYSRNDSDQFSESIILDMLWKKTGVLYEFAGRAGAAIGLKNADSEIPLARAIARFCSMCGTAFQIQDDILGIVGDEEQLGKPVGSDIREGKRTLLTLKALETNDHVAKARMSSILGSSSATPEEVTEVINLMREMNVIAHAQKVAARFVEQALEELALVPDSEYKILLTDWAEYLIAREF
jgi:geranylgeranyl diphosphate synthase type I